MASNIDKFRGLLRELFQLDQADLYFGIYRIMNQKRDEVVRFLDQDLLPQVQQAFAKYKSSDKTVLQAELAKRVAAIEAEGMNPDDSPKIKALKQQIAESSVDVAGLENEVFSHLFNFFRRYYEEGDFISLRRYKEGVYAIPYEGEEVKLHWANADQYYVKSSEYLRDYAFTVGGGKRVHFRLVEADTEKDNNKAAAGNERRFALADGDGAVAEMGGELIIRFTYKPDEQKRKQTALNDAAEKRIIEKAPGNWSSTLSAMRSASTLDPKPSVLRHHLTQYTARNTFDYFIHKNLGDFLRRELDFFIKNEVMYLDDVLPTEQDTPEHQQVVLAAAQAKMASRLSVIAILRDIARKIIRFLAQIEDFQKKLWLKKKFVVATEWLVTIDRVPQNLRDVVAKNERQWAAWDELGFKPVELPLGSPEWKTREYLDANDKLVVDTALFADNADFKTKLLASDDVLGDTASLDEATTGILFHSENFQALNVMQARFEGDIGAIYVDPPYNSDGDPILYKNDYRSASWLSLINDRLLMSKPLMASQACYALAIDDYEVAHLSALCDATFSGFEKNVVIVNHHPQGGMSSNVSRTHEYMIYLIPAGHDILRGKAKSGEIEYRSLALSGPGDNKSRNGRPNSFYAVLIDEANKKVVGVEPPPQKGTLYPTEATPEGFARRYPINADGDEKVWCRAYESALDAVAKGEIVVSETGALKLAIDTKGKRSSLMSNWTDSRYNAGPHGTALIRDILGSSGRFSYPKSLHTVIDAVESMVWSQQSPTVLDYFGGSGTTAHAVMSLNREDRGNRRFVMVEMGEHFITVVKPRVMKVMYSPEWKDGKAASFGSGLSGLVKVLRLEGYEDTLNNLRMTRTAEQADLLSQHKALAEEYMLGYVLDTESRGSASLLNVQAFSNPFAYTLNVTNGSAGETKPAVVDLIQTFNWLLGLRVKHIDHVRGVRVVDGTNPQGERVLVLWRNTAETDNSKLDTWFEKQDYSTRDMMYDVIYVNGDNNLENLRRGDETWKVRLIEEEFQRLMFDVQDV